MQVHSPISGVVVLNTIWKQGNIGEVQEGDQVRPGVPFMQVVDPSEDGGAGSGQSAGCAGASRRAKSRAYISMPTPTLSVPPVEKIIDPMGKPGDFSQKVRTFSPPGPSCAPTPRLLPGLSAAVDYIAVAGWRPVTSPRMRDESNPELLQAAQGHDRGRDPVRQQCRHLGIGTPLQSILNHSQPSR